MAKRRKKKGLGKSKPSPEILARANARLKREADERAAKQGRSRTDPELIKKLFEDPSKLPSRGKNSGKHRAKAERAAASVARRKASDTTSGAGKPSRRGKKRGTGGGRMTRGS